MGLGGAGGVKNFSVGIWDGAPSTRHSSFCIAVNTYTVNVSRATVSRRKGAYLYYLCIKADPNTISVSRATVTRCKGAYSYYVRNAADPYTVNEPRAKIFIC